MYTILDVDESIELPSVVWHSIFIISKGNEASQSLSDHVAQDASSHWDFILPDAAVFIITDHLDGFSKFASTHLQIKALFFASSMMLMIFTSSISASWFLESLLKSILVIPKAIIHIIAIHTIISPSVNAFVVLFLYIKSCQITKKI